MVNKISCLQSSNTNTNFATVRLSSVISCAVILDVVSTLITFSIVFSLLFTGDDSISGSHGSAASCTETSPALQVGH